MVVMVVVVIAKNTVVTLSHIDTLCYNSFDGVIALVVREISRSILSTRVLTARRSREPAFVAKDQVRMHSELTRP